MDAVHYVAELANCTHEKAEEALRLHSSVLEAVDSLLVIPGVSGDKYIPKTKTVTFADNDPEQAERVAERIDAGMVFVNVVEADGVELPFGGVKRSGFGRELGRFGIDEFVNKKLIRKG